MCFRILSTLFLHAGQDFSCLGYLVVESVVLMGIWGGGGKEKRGRGGANEGIMGSN